MMISGTLRKIVLYIDFKENTFSVLFYERDIILINLISKLYYFLRVIIMRLDDSISRIETDMKL